MPNLLEVKRIQILQELSQATQNIERDWDQLKNHSYNIDLGLLSAAPQLLEPALKASINSGESNHNKSVEFMYYTFLLIFRRFSINVYFINNLLNRKNELIYNSNNLQLQRFRADRKNKLNEVFKELING